MKFLIDIKNIEEMKRQIIEIEGEGKEITVTDYINLIDDTLNMFYLDATVELIESEDR